MIQPHPPHDPREIITQGAETLGIDLEPHAVDAMLLHIGLLREWRRLADLTALTDPRQVAVIHVLDSLTVFKVIPRGAGIALLDIGSGGGFPGLVLKTADPSLRLTLLDRNPRKIVFLKYVVHELGLKDVKFMNVRVEDLVTRDSHERFDAMVSRAVFSETGLLAGLTGLLLPRGFLVRMAGPASLQEPVELHGFRQTAVWEGKLPFSDARRRVLRYSPET
jgi:16S rRNA (guanine527-N7)-methyltransferase